MLQGIRPSQLYGNSKVNLSTSSANSRPSQPYWTDSDWQAMQESSNASNSLAQHPKGGVTKWKNKLKNFLTSPHPVSKPLVASSSQRSSEEDQQDIQVGPSAASSSSYGQHDLPGSESYEARLSKLVGDLEDVDYGAALQQFTNHDGESSSHPYAFSASTPTTFAEIQPPISIEEALNSFTTFGDYDFGDILVPSLADASTPSSLDPGPSSVPLSAVQSTASNVSQQSTSTTGTSIARDLVADASKLSNAKGSSNNTKHRALYPGDAASALVPFNSPVNGLDLQEASIASLSMPFSFEDLRNMGLVEGGGLDIGGGKEDDTFAKLIRQSQVAGHSQEESSDSNHSTLDLGHFNLNLFPVPGVLPSPITDSGSGPSPALSYGESSTSNTSFEELLPLDINATFRQGKSTQGLFQDESFRSKTPTHSPKPSLSSLPPTPSSYRAATSVPSTPHRPRPPPKVHASALAWRVAPTTLSPRSNIAVSPSKALHQMPSLSLSNHDSLTSPSRLNRLNTASSPELKRRRDDSDSMPTSIDARLGSQIGLRPVPQSPARPIAGRRRVAGKMEAPPLRQSHSQHQLYQPQQQQSYAPQMPHTQSNAWLSEDIVRNLYTQLDSRTYLCSLQGCHQTFHSDQQVRSHIQAHFAAPQTQQIQPQQSLWV